MKNTTTTTTQCWSCQRTDVRKRPRSGKRFYAHKCPHGVPCIAGHSLMGAGGFNGPARGGPCYCPQCVAAYELHAREQREAAHVAHAAADPDCTCNDCMADHIAQAEAAETVDPRELHEDYPGQHITGPEPDYSWLGCNRVTVEDADASVQKMLQRAGVKPHPEDAPFDSPDSPLREQDGELLAAPVDPAISEVEALLHVILARLSPVGPQDSADWHVIAVQLRAAARIARKAAAFAKHQTDDPHCTCNDCIEDFSRKSDEEGQ